MHNQPVGERAEERLRSGGKARESHWPESVAVGSKRFVERVRKHLGLQGRHRVTWSVEQGRVLREPGSGYRSSWGAKRALQASESGEKRRKLNQISTSLGPTCSTPPGNPPGGSPV